MFSKGSLLFVSIALVALLGGVSGVPFCLTSLPKGGVGANCAGDLECSGALYCNNQSICAEALLPGTPCTSADTCKYNSLCKGPTGASLCVAYANPGASCSSSQTSVLPSCASGFLCDTLTNTCILGGATNDTCTKNNDCASLLCVNAKCFGFPLGGSCQSSSQCAPGLFCQGYTGVVNGTCTALLTSGTCTTGSQCAFGYVCERPSPTDAIQCLKEGSRKAGEFCGSTGSLCEGSSRCRNNYCAKNSGESCSSNTHCSSNQVCSCSGGGRYEGIGSCVSAGCIGAYDSLRKCALDNCNGISYQYSGSCANTFCSGQITGYYNCMSAGATLGQSFLFVALLAFVASYFKF